MAQRTETLRFGPLVYTVNLYHPLRLIDEICMLDQMSGGRLELGVGRGISPYEVGYYGVDPGDRAGALRRGARGDPEGPRPRSGSTIAGKYFTFKDVPMEMQPVQRPHPPLWYGANSLESADRLAKQACNTRGRHEGRGRRPVRRALSRRLEGAGPRRADLPLIGLSRHIVVGDTDKEAQSAAKRAFALLVRRADPSLARPRRRPAAPADPRRSSSRRLTQRLHHRRLALDGARAAEARQRHRRHQLLPLPAGLRRPVVRGVEALGRSCYAEGSDAGALTRSQERKERSADATYPHA